MSYHFGNRGGLIVDFAETSPPGRNLQAALTALPSNQYCDFPTSSPNLHASRKQCTVSINPDHSPGGAMSLYGVLFPCVESGGTG